MSQWSVDLAGVARCAEPGNARYSAEHSCALFLSPHSLTHTPLAISHTLSTAFAGTGSQGGERNADPPQLQVYKEHELRLSYTSPGQVVGGAGEVALTELLGEVVQDSDEVDWLGEWAEALT